MLKYCMGVCQMLLKRKLRTTTQTTHRERLHQSHFYHHATPVCLLCSLKGFVDCHFVISQHMPVTTSNSYFCRTHLLQSFYCTMQQSRLTGIKSLLTVASEQKTCALVAANARAP